MELLAMGEYGPFVWSSYFLTLVVVIVSACRDRKCCSGETSASSDCKWHQTKIES
jgi:hypothetical protein